MTKADFNRARESYPSTSMTDDGWIAVLAADSYLFWSILADVYKAALAEEERARGLRRAGRPSRRVPSSVDELLGVVFPQHET